MGSLLDDQDLTLEGPILHRSDHETKYIRLLANDSHLYYNLGIPKICLNMKHRIIHTILKVLSDIRNILEKDT